MNSAIITGATGTIGTALIDGLISRNIKVTAILNPNSSRNESILNNPLLTKTFCDLSNLDTLNLPQCNYDCFFHLGWSGTTGSNRQNTAMQKLNFENTLSAVRLACKLNCKKFVGVGSQAEFGPKNIPLTPSLSCEPQTQYGKYKLKAGISAKNECAKLGIQFNWVRVLSVYGGKGDKASLISYTVNELSKGNTPKFTKSEQIWDFLYCKDAALALYLVAEKGVNGKTYILGSGKGLPLSDCIKTIYKVCSPDKTPHFGALPYADDQCMYLAADIGELVKDTGFIPRFSLEHGVRETAKEAGLL